MHLAQEVAKKINPQGDQAVAYQVDVSKEEQVEAMIEFAVEQFGTITGIFNNAGIGLVKPFLVSYPSNKQVVLV